MKAQDLRLGNHVKTDNSTEHYMDIETVDLEILTEIENGSEFYKPIELTEEWLLKLGGCHVINNMFKLNNFIIKISEQGFYVVWMNERLFFRYVHDLQNWYYLTTKLIRGTGEELAIKETVK